MSGDLETTKKGLALVSFPFQSPVPHLLELVLSENGVRPEQGLAESGQSKAGVVTVGKTSTLWNCHVRAQRSGKGIKVPSSSPFPLLMCCTLSHGFPVLFVQRLLKVPESCLCSGFVWFWRR